MSIINSGIFKAYDIRGIYGQDFTDEFAYRLGLAFVALRRQDPDYRADQGLQIAVAYDMRLSSENLKTELIRGLIEAGANVLDLGMISTPTFYFAVSHYNCQGGLIVSASHNPKEWNGFKITRSKGIPVSGETGLEFLKNKVLENKFTKAAIPGSITYNNQALADETEHAFNFAGSAYIKPFKIVADTANGMGATYLEALCAKLPIQLIPLNFSLDGSFPAHEADPLKEENLAQLKGAVLKNQADLGIAIDGDGDRIFLLDDQGETINPAILRGLLAKIFLRDKPGSKIAYDVRPGKITPDLIKENGGQPVLARVGHSLIKELMLKENVYFAGESSGHFFLNIEKGCFEYPGIMLLKLLAEFSTLSEPLSKYLHQYKKYFHSGEINRLVKDKDLVLKKLKEKYADGEISELDGVSISYPDFWFNVRGSNTEPKMRLNLEAISPEVMTARRDEVLKFLE